MHHGVKILFKKKSHVPQFSIPFFLINFFHCCKMNSGIVSDVFRFFTNASHVIPHNGNKKEREMKK